MLDDKEFEMAGSLVWRLLIQAPATEADKGNELEDLEDDYHVVLVGYKPATKSIKSMWISDAVTSTPVRATLKKLPEEQFIARKSPVLKHTQNDMELTK